MRRRRSLIAVVVVALAVGLAGVVAAWPRPSSTSAGWVVRDLGTLGGRESTAYGINEGGQVVGRSQVNGGVWRAFLWQKGKMVDLATLGGSASEAHAINDRGQVVGWSAIRKPGVVHAFLWQGGKMRDLGTLGGRGSWARAANARGEIVGWSETKAGAVHAFLWRNGKMNDLGTLGGLVSVAVGINDGGQVVGTSETGTGKQRRVFLWQDGKMRDLGKSTDPGPGRPSWWVGGGDGAAGINNRGQIIGYGGYVWRAGKITHLQSLNDFATPKAINDRGDIVGESDGHGGSQPATLWASTNLKPTGLPNPSSEDLGGGITAGIDWAGAAALNEHGQIAGTAAYYCCEPEALWHAVLWTVKPGS